MKNPFFSIILPTYNVEPYIERCITSCINQSYKNFELIFVDDCGQDNSIKIIKKWIDLDHRIKIIYNQTNLGTFHARKRGVEESKGNYVLFLDPDDSLPKDSLLKIKEEIKNRNIDLILYGIESINKEKTKKKLPKSKKTNINNNILYYVFHNVKNVSHGTPGKLYASHLIKKTYKKLSYINERLTFGEDALLFFTASSLASTLYISKEILYTYHRNEGSITKRIDKESIAHQDSQLDKIIQHINLISTEKEIITINSDTINKSKSILIDNFIYTKQINKRFLYDEKNGKSLYLKTMLKSLQTKARTKIILRIIIYILTIKKIKI